MIVFRQQLNLMLFNPETGERIAPVKASVWRRENNGAWLYDPWTGKARTPLEIGSDVKGSLIDDGDYPCLHVLKAIRQQVPVSETIEIMRDNNCSMDEPLGDEGEPIIMIAAYHGNAELVKYLLDNGANPRTHGGGVSALAYAARHSAILTLLLQTEAIKDVNQVYKPHFFTPLMVAINIQKGGSAFGIEYDYDLVEDRIGSIKMLLAAGAEINAINSFGRTAIMGAAATNDPRLVYALLPHNPKLDARCNDGKLAMDYADTEELKELLSPH